MISVLLECRMCGASLETGSVTAANGVAYVTVEPCKMCLINGRIEEVRKLRERVESVNAQEVGP